MRHCRFCGYTGHNIRTCPSRSQDSKQHDKNQYSKYRSRSRRCRYCRENGHDRRKCEQLKQDRVKWIADNALYRKRFLEDMKNSGIGIGAIVQSYDSMYMVGAIEWDAINNDNRYSYPICTLPIENMDERGTINFPSYFGTSDENREYYIVNGGRQIKAVNPASANAIEKSVPDGWLNGISHKNMPMHLR